MDRSSLIFFSARQSGVCFALLLSFATPSALHAQSGKPLTAEQIASNAAWNELHASNEKNTYSYRLRKQDVERDTTKIIVETTEGDVARLIETDGKPLSADANQAELNRLNNLRDDKGLQEHRRKREQADAARAAKMIRLLPQAFNFSLAGTVPGPSGPCYRLTFTPKPTFVPPDRESEVYHGMEGELWVDQAQQRMVRLDAHLISDVDVGWGLVGRLFKGGSALVEQKDVGGHHWETTHLELNLNGKILMMKQLKIHTIQNASDFHPVPNDGYQAAISMVEKLPSH